MSMYQSCGGSNTFYTKGGSGGMVVDIKLRDDVGGRGDLGSWFRTSDARKLAGKWVMLDDNYKTVRWSDRPGDLLKAREIGAVVPLIVFADPSIVFGMARRLHSHIYR